MPAKAKKKSVKSSSAPSRSSSRLLDNRYHSKKNIGLMVLIVLVFYMCFVALFMTWAKMKKMSVYDYTQSPAYKMDAEVSPTGEAEVSPVQKKY